MFVTIDLLHGGREGAVGLRRGTACSGLGHASASPIEYSDGACTRDDGPNEEQDLGRQVQRVDPGTSSSNNAFTKRIGWRSDRHQVWAGQRRHDGPETTLPS